jgi:hypothetical protein
VYVALALGLLTKKPHVLNVIDFWLKVFISLFLVWRFNPFLPAKFTEFDRKVVFSAGLFIFTITIVNIYLKLYIKEAREYVGKKFEGIKNGIVLNN